jgi:lactam utilization protein B
VWRRLWSRLGDEPALARFLTQIDESPLRVRAHQALPDDEPFNRLAMEMAPHLVALPIEIIYELGLAPAIRLAASNMPLDEDQLGSVIASCWRAISPVQ